MQSAPSSTDSTDAGSFTPPHAHSPSQRKTLQFKQRRNISDKDLESTLMAALLSTDKELSQVLRELDEISAALKSGKPEDEALRVAVHPAVWYAVRQSLIERELRHLALCDDLTCLYNRRGFFAAATQQLKVARRNLKSAVLLFCDLDGLKLINDTFGHREGDLALVRTAGALETVFRDSDVVGRLGGDEFAVLATDLSPAHQQTILARLQKALNHASKDEPRYALSLSVGSAWFDPHEPISLGELMEQADRAMYDRKRGSRIPLFTKEAVITRKNAGASKPAPGGFAP